jgi:hypothetical protein
VITRVVFGLLLLALAIVAGLRLGDLSRRLDAIGDSYLAFQCRAGAIDEALAAYSGIRSDVAEAIFTDIGFAFCYSIGLALLFGSAAEGLTHSWSLSWTARALSLGAWLVLAAGMADLSENYALLAGFYEFGEGANPPDVSAFGYAAHVFGIVKWTCLAVGLVALVAGVLWDVGRGVLGLVHRPTAAEAGS